MKKILIYALSTFILVVFSACSIKKDTSSNDMVLRKLNDLEYQLAQKDERIKELQKANVATQSSFSQTTKQAPVVSNGNYGNDLVPPNARAGECYAKVLQPTRYKRVKERVLVTPQREKVNLVPATYRWVTKRVVVEDASYKLVNIPATYKWVKARVQVEPSREKLIKIPAKYKEVSEKILIRDAYTTWKKGRGAFEKVNNKTGDIMCLIEVPAEYKTLKKKVLVESEQTKVIKIPAKYSVLKKKVLVNEAQTKRIPTKPVYKQIKVKELVSPAHETRVSVPAQYKTIEKKVIVSPSSISWKKILCETNVTKNVVRRLQQKLKSLNYYYGPIDGKFGNGVRTALKSYQKSKGYAQGALTIESLQSLNLI